MRETPADATADRSATARPTFVRHLVLAALCLMAAIAYLQRGAMGVAAPDMRQDLQLSQEEFGAVLSAFFWGYAVFQIPAGWLGAKWGSRRGLALFAVACSLCAGLVALAPNRPVLVVAWFGAGIAQAGLFPCCAITFAHWFPESQRSLPNGLLGSFMSVGAIASTALTGLLLGRLGWTWPAVFALYALPGLAWAVPFLLWFRNRPEEHAGVNAAELAAIRDGKQDDRTDRQDDAADPSPRSGRATADDVSGERPCPMCGRRVPVEAATCGFCGENLATPPQSSTPWLQVVGSLAMWMLCAQQFFRAAGYVFYQTWFVTYLKEVHEVSTEKAGYLNSLPLLGVVLGGFVGGPLADWIFVKTGSRRLSRQLVGGASQVVCAALIVAAYSLKDPELAVVVISLGAFAFAFGSCAAYTVTIDLAGPHVAPVFATMNMCGNFGAALSPLVVGRLVESKLLAWDSILLVFAGIYVAAALCWAALNPNGTLFDRPQKSPNLPTGASSDGPDLRDAPDR